MAPWAFEEHLFSSKMGSFVKFRFSRGCIALQATPRTRPLSAPSSPQGVRLAIMFLYYPKANSSCLRVSYRSASCSHAPLSEVVSLATPNSIRTSSFGDALQA
jgi:hypothetical protein